MTGTSHFTGLSTTRNNVHIYVFPQDIKLVWGWDVGGNGSRDAEVLPLSPDCLLKRGIWHFADYSSD